MNNLKLRLGELPRRDTTLVKRERIEETKTGEIYRATIYYGSEEKEVDVKFFTSRFKNEIIGPNESSDAEYKEFIEYITAYNKRHKSKKAMLNKSVIFWLAIRLTIIAEFICMINNIRLSRLYEGYEEVALVEMMMLLFTLSILLLVERNRKLRH